MPFEVKQFVSFPSSFHIDIDIDIDIDIMAGPTPTRIAIIGAGTVGAASAYALLLGSIASEILLVDVKTDWRDGQAHDLSDAAYSTQSTTRVRTASYHEAAKSDIVVITAGSKPHFGEYKARRYPAGIQLCRSSR